MATSRRCQLARADTRSGVRHPRECKDGARALNGAAGARVGTVPRAALSVGRGWRVDGSGCARACASLSLCVAGSGRDQTHLSEESVESLSAVEIGVR